VSVVTNKVQFCISKSWQPYFITSQNRKKCYWEIFTCTHVPREANDAETQYDPPTPGQYRQFPFLKSNALP
jgi:hypothetical protein